MYTVYNRKSVLSMNTPRWEEILKDFLSGESSNVTTLELQLFKHLHWKHFSTVFYQIKGYERVLTENWIGSQVKLILHSKLQADLSVSCCADGCFVLRQEFSLAIALATILLHLKVIFHLAWNGVTFTKLSGFFHGVSYKNVPLENTFRVKQT